MVLIFFLNLVLIFPYICILTAFYNYTQTVADYSNVLETEKFKMTKIITTF